MMAAPRITSSNPWHLTRVVWIAELWLIPLSNNAVALIFWRTGIDLYPVLAAVLYTYISIRHLRVLPFGFVWSRRSIMVGIVAGLALSLPAMIFFIHPILVGNVSYGPIATLSVNGLLRRTLVDLPFLTAIIEELVFRHWLFIETTSANVTVLFNAFIFTVWHGVAAFAAMSATQFGGGGGVLVLAYLGSLAAVFVAGVIFAIVRLKTGSFVYAVLAHWISDASIVVVIWSLGHLAH